MNLYDIALLFKNQLLDKFYIINTPTNIIYIRTFPKNLLHLTGLQRTKEFCKIRNLPKFYNDCLSQRYLKDTLKYTYSNSQDRNLVDMKVSNFDKIQSTILNAQTLYYTRDKSGDISTVISVNFLIKKSNKYLTIVFKRDKQSKFYVPVSIQLDQNLSRSVVSKAYKQEDISGIQMLDYFSPMVHDIIKNSRSS